MASGNGHNTPTKLVTPKLRIVKTSGPAIEEVDKASVAFQSHKYIAWISNKGQIGDRIVFKIAAPNVLCVGGVSNNNLINLTMEVGAPLFEISPMSGRGSIHFNITLKVALVKYLKIFKKMEMNIILRADCHGLTDRATIIVTVIDDGDESMESTHDIANTSVPKETLVATIASLGSIMTLLLCIIFCMYWKIRTMKTQAHSENADGVNPSSNSNLTPGVPSAIEDTTPSDSAGRNRPSTSSLNVEVGSNQYDTLSQASGGNSNGNGSRVHPVTVLQTNRGYQGSSIEP